MNTTEMQQKAVELRAHAAECERRKQESFERCDTDGFLTQHSFGICAERDETRALIFENGGRHTFIGLYQGARRVKAKLINTRFSYRTITSWLIHSDEKDVIARRGRPFLPAYTNGKSRILNNLGLTEQTEIAPADAKISGRGTGLSGQTWVEVYRTGDPYGQDAVLEGVEDLLRKQGCIK